MDEARILARLRGEVSGLPRICDLFSRDRDRGRRLSFSACGILLDLSGNPLTDSLLGLLCDYARARKVPERLREQFTCARPNVTEGRMACHPLLRVADPSAVDGAARRVARAALAERGRFVAFAESVRRGSIVSSSGKRFTDIVHLGTGGSHWPPRLLHEAFGEVSRGIRCHFVATGDPVALGRILSGLDRRRTLAVVASKSFATRETMGNARAVAGWLAEGIPSGGLADHLAAVTGAPAKARSLGIPAGRVFRVWDWVGGRYSVWSACALPAVATMGAEAFGEFLAGGREMDDHVLRSPEASNLPVLAALSRVWVHDFLGHPTRCMVVYGHPLRALVSHCQQLLMESCGKTVRVGKGGTGGRCEVLWGGEGPVGEHSFHQFLLQGGVPVPVEMVAYARPWGAPADSGHRRLLAHCVGQGLALRDGWPEGQARAHLREQGRTAREVRAQAPHLAIPGNQPLTTVMLEELSPRALGALLAFHEHATVAQAALRGVNPFDQWGVETGKRRTREADGWLDPSRATGQGAGAPPHLARHALEAMRTRPGRRPSGARSPGRRDSPRR